MKRKVFQFISLIILSLIFIACTLADIKQDQAEASKATPITSNDIAPEIEPTSTAITPVAVYFIDQNKGTYRITWSPDSQFVASEMAGIIFIWQIDPLIRQNTFWRLDADERSLETVYSLTFSPEGKFLATGWTDGMIIIWDLSTNDEILRIQNTGVPSLLYFAETTPILIANSVSDRDPALAAWNVENGDLLWRQAMKSGVYSVDLHSDDRHLIVGTSYTGLEILDAITGEKLWQQWTESDDFLNTVSDVIVDESNEQFISVESDGTVRRWGLSSHTLLETIHVPQNVKDVNNILWGKIDPSGSKIAAHLDYTDGLIVWDIQSEQILLSIPSTSSYGYVDQFTEKVWSPDGKYLAAISFTGIITIWEVP